MFTNTWECYVLPVCLFLVDIIAVFREAEGMKEGRSPIAPSIASIHFYYSLIVSYSTNWPTLHVAVSLCIDPNVYFTSWKPKGSFKHSIFAIAAALLLWLIQLWERYPMVQSPMIWCHTGFLFFYFFILFRQSNSHTNDVFVLQCRCMDSQGGI